MQFPVTRLPDSLILSKLAKIAHALARRDWNVAASGEHYEMFSVTSTPDESTPWEKNGMAKKLSTSSGVIATSFILTVDGTTIVSVRRPNNEPFDRIDIAQNQFGNSEEMRFLYATASDLVGSEFTVARSRADMGGVSSELARFVENRDLGLVRLEELYTRFTQKMVEDRERLVSELREKESSLQNAFDLRKAEMDAEFQERERVFRDEKAQLETKLKEVDNREAKFVRREIRNQLKQEIKNRQSKFELTQGTQRMRWPVIAAVLSLTAILGFGFYYYTVEIVKEMTAQKPPEGYVLAVMIVRQVLIGAGLGGCAWFYIHWQNQWSQRHADEEFAVKRLELDLDRASWVVELAMEWSKEKHGQELPDSILEELTKNLFNDRDAVTSAPTKPDVMSALLDASTKAEISVGDAKFSLDRKATEKLKRALQSE